MDFIKENIIPGEVLVQLIAFLIVFFTLKALAWKPLQTSLEERRLRIKNELEKIESTKQDVERMKVEYTAHLQKIEDAARAKILESVEEGRRIARDIQEKARAESQASFDKAKENIELEVVKARVTLRNEIAELAVNASEHILKEKLSTTKAQQDKLLEIIGDLEKSL